MLVVCLPFRWGIFLLGQFFWDISLDTFLLEKSNLLDLAFLFRCDKLQADLQFYHIPTITSQLSQPSRILGLEILKDRSCFNPVDRFPKDKLQM